MRSWPVAVELFTSQGCSSCPPADALFARLANDPNVVAMTQPVTLWDPLGWRDTGHFTVGASLLHLPGADRAALLLRQGDAGPILAARYL